jgi:hypothetical protein
LFYKTDAYRLGSSGDTATYDIKIDVKPEITNNKDFEILLNNAQMDSNA